jgi:hypothetical protein
MKMQAVFAFRRCPVIYFQADDSTLTRNAEPFAWICSVCARTQSPVCVDLFRLRGFGLKLVKN